jgi:hypothetical protein
MPRLARSAIIILAGLILSIVTVGAATAATPPLPPLHKTVTALGPRLQDVITCDAKANNPHHSTHDPSTVNATGSITCSAPVVSITMTMYLYWSGYIQNSATCHSTGESSVSCNVAAPCVTGGWQVSEIGEIHFPPGYEPNPQSVSASKEANVSSC